MFFSLFRPALQRLAILLAALAGLMLPGLALAQDGYKLRSGDVLRVEVVEDANLNRAVLVAPDGRITLPLAGSVPAGGRTVEEVQADVAARLAGSFAAPPTVYVALERVVERPAGSGGARATIDVYVMGEGASPGRLDVERGTTLLQAFAQMGGFSPFAATKRIQLRRAGKTYVIDYTAIEAGTSTAGATVMQRGDVILVPQRRLFE